MGLSIIAGIIDLDYRGELSIILYNHLKDALLYLAEGLAIAQLIIYLINTDDLKPVEKLKLIKGSINTGSIRLISNQLSKCRFKGII